MFRWYPKSPYEHLLNDYTFMGWLKEKAENSPDETYNYWCDKCLIGQFLRSHDVPLKSVGIQCFMVHNDLKEHILPFHWDVISRGHFGESKYWTFKQAYARALEMSDGQHIGN